MDCVPLYPAQVVWQQLASEQRSRVNACNGVRSRRDWPQTLKPLIYPGFFAIRHKLAEGCRSACPLPLGAAPCGHREGAPQSRRRPFTLCAVPYARQPQEHGPPIQSAFGVTACGGMRHAALTPEGIVGYRVIAEG